MKKKKVRIYKKPNQVQEPMFNMGGKMYSEPELIGMYPEAYKQYQMAYGGKLPQHGFGEWLGNNADTIGSVVGGIGGAFLGPAGAAAGSKLGGMLGSTIKNKYQSNQMEDTGIEQVQPDMLNQEACNCEEPRREAAATNTFAMGGSLKKCMKCGGKTHYPDGGIITTTDSKGNIMLGRTKDDRENLGKGYGLQGLVFNPNTGKIGGRAELNSNNYKNNKFNQAFAEIGRIPGSPYAELGFKTGKGGDFYLGNKKLSGNTYLSGGFGVSNPTNFLGAGIGGNILIPIGKKGLNLFGQGDLGVKYTETDNPIDAGLNGIKDTKLDGNVTAGIRYKFENGGAIQNPQYEAEGGEVIQADGMQIHGGGGNPNLSYRADGGAMINGVDHKADSADPNSGVKLSSSGSTDGRIFSKRLKNPATKKPFAKEADALLKKVGKYEEIVKDNKSESIAKRTAQIMADKYNAQLDELFEAQESLKQEQGIQDSSLGTDEAVGAAKADAMGALPEGTPTQATLDIMKQQMAGIPAEQTMPQIPMGAMGGKLPQHFNGFNFGALQGAMSNLYGNDTNNFGSFLGTTASIPTTIYDLVQGSKDPYQWETLQNQQQANALGMYDQAKAGLGTMGDTISGMDTQALKDFQASRDIYNQMGDLDVSQQRADVKSGTGNMMSALRGGAGSRQELLAGGQNIFNQQTAKLGQVEGYKNQFDAEQQARRAAGLERLGGQEATIQSQKAGLLGQQAGLLGQLGGLYNQIGQQEREYLQYMNELARQERDLKDAQRRSGMAGIGNFLGDLGSAFTAKKFDSEI